MTIKIFNLKPINAASFWGSKSGGNIKSASVYAFKLGNAEQVIQVVKYWHKNLASAIVHYMLMETAIFRTWETKIDAKDVLDIQSDFMFISASSLF